jgi:uncharacterized protein YbjT (DUF2867 family)
MAATAVRPRPILLTGATGYIGGRLLRRLQDEGQPVRCFTRRPDVLARGLRPSTTVVEGDALAPASVGAALADVKLAYYLVHSMAAGDDFAELDRRAAANFAAAACEAGVSQIVYLGGLGHDRDLSPHLSSRHEVGRILRSSGVPTLELRSSIVIGSGSASYEAVRAVVELLPVVLAPRWAETRTQPIAVEDVVDYLVAASRLEESLNEIVEIGGSDPVAYAEIMREYARQRGLRRTVIPTPLATPFLARWFLSLATPVYGQIAATMVDSMRNETTLHSNSADTLFDARPRGLREAIERALRNEDLEYAETRWSDATPADVNRWGGASVGHRRVFTRSLQVDCRESEAFAPIQRIGGPTGWYYWNWFWWLRGLLDVARGGVGLRRGRRDPTDLRVGDTVDFWRVERFEPDRLLLLHAEMRIPGRLWLQFEIGRRRDGTQLRQTTVFDAHGFVGLGYWYLLYPLHRRIFDGMLDGIGRAMQPRDVPRVAHARARALLPHDARRARSRLARDHGPARPRAEITEPPLRIDSCETSAAALTGRSRRFRIGALKTRKRDHPLCDLPGCGVSKRSLGRSRLSPRPAKRRPR